MDELTFKKFQKMIYDIAGISLHSGKKTLVAARISKRMKALNIPTHKDYLNYVQEDTSNIELIYMIDAISTNVTNFFREPDHFEFLKKIFTKWQNEGQKKFRFWCAAASTGEEPYTIALTLNEATLKKFLDVKILATDISISAIEKCKEAVYSEKIINPVPKSLINKYFVRESIGNGKYQYRVNNALKSQIFFGRLNLSKPPFPMKGPLDIVFCRNVMIYFDKIVKERLAAEVYRLLKPGGYFIVGHSESLTGIPNRFKTLKPSIYVKE